MAYAPYEFLFTDQNPNREFVVQPYTTNGPSSPDGGVDPSAANANTTLFLYGKGSPNYGDRIQENLVYMLEHFFSPIEPSFPIPGQLWCRSSSNELATPFQMFMFNPRQVKVTASSSNQIYVVSDDGSLTQAQILQRFQALGLAKQFTVYDAAYNQTSFVQSASPIVSGPSNVLLTVTPAVVSNLTGQFIGGWEEIYQGNAEVVLRRPFNANSNNIINLAAPVNPGDAANKAYVDSAVTGGGIALAGLSDVSIVAPVTGQILQFNGLKWFNSSLTSQFLPLAGGTMGGTINMNGSSITNLPPPVGIYDAVNKQYVDEQPLSGASVTITSPSNGDILYYNSSLFKWLNAQPAIAGVVPISGAITFTGPISMGNQALTLVPTPINPTDAANKAYVDATFSAGSGVVTSGAYDQNTGILSLLISGGFPEVFVPGFLPTPNGFVPAPEVNFIPQNPSSLPQNPPNQFFPTVMGDATIVGPNDIQDPISMTLQALLNQIDVALGNFVPPRTRLVIPMPGTTGRVDLNHGNGLFLAGSPNATYVKGSENLAVYLNGVKQIASTSASTKITNFTCGGTYAASFFAPNMTIVGNVARVFHPGVQFNVSGTSTSNDGNFIVATSTVVAGNTVITAIPNGYNLVAGQLSPFVTSSPGTVTYTVTKLRDDMETGYTAVTPLTLQVAVNGLSPVTVSINPSTTNISNLGLLRDAVNTIAMNHYMNSVTTTTGITFQVPGNVAYAFPAGTNFRVRYSNGNDGAYVVSLSGSTYAAGFTTINVSAVPFAGPPRQGVIFQDNWGFTMNIVNGNIVFNSNIPGNDPVQIRLVYPGYIGGASGISVTDPGVGLGLLSSIVGKTWPMTFNTPVMSPGFITTVDAITQPTGGTVTVGTYPGVSLTGGTGVGAVGTIVVSGTPSLTLGTAVTYGVIASSTITNTGATTINGDVALSPAGSITGAPTVTGTTHNGDGAAATALADATTAYTTGSTLPGATVLSASTYDLGSTVVTPGLYSIGSSATITGTVTLDAGGDPNATFIFQIGSTLLPQNSSVVLLTNSAQAKNVYWFVGSSATIGTSATFNGTVIAQISITTNTSAVVTGHLFALTGAVSLDTNIVTATTAGAGGSLIIESITITSPGIGYVVGDVLSYNGAGYGTGGTATVGVTNNSIAPADYAYSEVGMCGSSSSLFIFNVPPISIDVMEVIVDRELVYNTTNPLAAATIQP